MKNLQQRKTNASDPVKEEAQAARVINADYDKKYGFNDDIENSLDLGPGIDEEKIRKISAHKNEPAWMLDLRLKAFAKFKEMKMPTWGADLSGINFDDIHYYVRATDKQGRSWDEVPEKIKNTFEKLGIPQAERKFLAGVASQYESEVIYHKLKEQWTKLGVVFEDTDTGLQKYPEIYKKYFSRAIPYSDNKFAALNTAVWSGGSFIYVPKGVKITVPLQAYFRINTRNMGQFERTLIVVDEGAEVHYIEGCFLAGARVKTLTEIKNIEDIVEGDKVLTHTNTYRKVYKTMVREYKGPIHTIKYWGDTNYALKVTSEHPLQIVRRKKLHDRNKDFDKEWVEAKDVNVKDYLVQPIPKISSKLPLPVIKDIRYKSGLYRFEFPFERDFFRLIGYYLAEGYVSNEHYITLSFNENETDLIEDAKILLEKYSGKSAILNKVRNSGQTIVLSDTKLARTFADFFGTTSSNKRIPYWFRYLTREMLIELIKGMWLGDGSFDVKLQKFRFNSINENLTYTFREMLLSLGILCTVNVQTRKPPRKKMYTVVVSTRFNETFGAIVGVTAKNGIAAGSPLEIHDGFLFMPIKTITTEYQETKVYNFSVEDDESYVAEGAICHNCTAPSYTTDSLHAAVVEIYVEKGARCRYTTIQNWSDNVYNLVTKRAFAKKDAVMEWVDCNLGSKVTMKYPSVYLLQPGAHGEVLSIAMASEGQHQDAGAKMIHKAPHTSSLIMSKSICMNGGRTSYRGMVQIPKGARHTKSNVICDALILDSKSRTDTYPYNLIDEQDVTLGHEASVSRVNEEQLFYLMSRGLSEEEAASLIVAGFVEPVVKELPMEYAMELNALISMSMAGSVG